MSECRNDEFSDWPQSLLAIGTFGNKKIEEEAQSSSGDVQAVQDSVKFTEEEVDSIRKEFESLLESSDQAEVQGSYAGEQVASQKRVGEHGNEKRQELLMNKEIIISKAREIVGKKGGAIKPRSIASLLRLFMCKGGFTAPVLEPRNSFPQTRMEKVQSNSSVTLQLNKSLNFLCILLIPICGYGCSCSRQYCRRKYTHKLHPR